jgi:hypothetical protein
LLNIILVIPVTHLFDKDYVEEEELTKSCSTI